MNPKFSSRFGFTFNAKGLRLWNVFIFINKVKIMQLSLFISRTILWS